MKQEAEFVIADIIKETAAKTAEAIYEKLKQDAKKGRDKQINNTKLLLENYRIFKEHVDNAVFDLVRLDEENETAFEILDSMWQRFGVGRAEMKVQSIVKSATRTRIIFEHVQSMLGLYESFCYNSGKDENIRRWEVIKALYIDDTQGRTPSEICTELAEKFFTDPRTIYRWQLDAIEKISVLVFGIDGLKN